MEKIQIVLASPSDLSEERMMIRKLVDELNPLYMQNDICIDLRMWENSVASMNADGPQGVIDLDLEIPCSDIFVCLYWKRVGTVIEVEDVAGTEHELNVALDSYRKNRHPDIKVFFKTRELDNTTDDYKKIQEIAVKLQNKGLYDSFSSIEELRGKINRAIQKEVMERLKRKAAIIPEIHKYIEVSSTNDLVKNLESNNKLVLNKGYYDILDFEAETETVFKQDVFDGKEVVIQGISNVTIVGDNTTLLATPRYANVINFNNCTNIKLIGLTIGHIPYKGDCTGAVLAFEDCNNVQLESLELYGCGTYGIVLHNCKNIKVNGTKIFECSYGAMQIIASDLFFENSKVFDCNKIAGSLFETSFSQLQFSNVSIFNNHIDSSIFYIENSTLFCRGVSIFSNTYSALSNVAIPFGIHEEDNIVISEMEWNLTVSKEKATREEYDDIKEICVEYGKIEEAILVDGHLYINVIFINDDKAEQLTSELYKYDDIVVARG
ncbi:MAG: right-handed parallel beta-helix repeat-containing protein [Lachnospiraceae bacterium]|nr:right-handed parallel beta-helix repeat-containing protein [Lachnospiraceae bacterium]